MSTVETREFTLEDLAASMKLCVECCEDEISLSMKLLVVPDVKLRVTVDDNESNVREDYRTWYPIRDQKNELYWITSTGDSYWLLNDEEFDFEE